MHTLISTATDARPDSCFVRLDRLMKVKNIAITAITTTPALASVTRRKEAARDEPHIKQSPDQEHTPMSQKQYSCKCTHLYLSMAILSGGGNACGCTYMYLVVKLAHELHRRLKLCWEAVIHRYMLSDGSPVGQPTAISIAMRSSPPSPPGGVDADGSGMGTPSEYNLTSGGLSMLACTASGTTASFDPQ